MHSPLYSTFGLWQAVHPVVPGALHAAQLPSQSELKKKYLKMFFNRFRFYQYTRHCIILLDCGRLCNRYCQVHRNFCKTHGRLFINY